MSDRCSFDALFLEQVRCFLADTGFEPEAIATSTRTTSATTSAAPHLPAEALATSNASGVSPLLYPRFTCVKTQLLRTAPDIRTHGYESFALHRFMV